ncbi:kelch domain-containing protein 2 [Chanos chanos]|uniref:Kelch domain-containing protein 2 n=1 Tax=Chanos chanos TaxID=29144 RepID=A0A6J2W4G4_CHACN|nr:kelch domain-containing protein 2 [Chanos chanos]
MAENADDHPDLQDDEEESEHEDDVQEIEWIAQHEEGREFDWVEDAEVVVATQTSGSLSLEVPAERSGHIAVVDGNCMYVWGGYKNAETAGLFDLYLPKAEVWIYNMETGRWRMQLSEGDLPAAMSGSCGVCVDGVLYLFGGHHARGNTNKVYRLPLRSSVLRWERMRTLSGLAPTCKDKLGCWVYQNRLVYFGGYGYIAQPEHRGRFELDENSFMGNHQGRGWNNHIHILDLETLTWSQPVTKGNGPSPRAAHACATVKNRGYVFGGRFLDYRLNDLYYINMDTWEWSEMCVPQNGPVGRSWHAFTPVSTDHIFLFGGFTTNRETLSDAWLYCVSRNEWAPFKHNHTDSPRLWHTACRGPDGEVFVFGGCANNLLSQQRAEHSNELLVFAVQPRSLLRSCMEVVVQNRTQLEPMWDFLPKHLLHSLKERMPSSNTGGS